MKTRLLLVCATAAIALVACRDSSRDNYDRTHPNVIPQDRPPSDQSSTTTLTSAAMMSLDSATDRIVAARCARELTCSRVGPDRHFPTTDTCVVEVRKRTRRDLESAPCERGIDATGLDKCLDAIRNESCENGIETLGRMVSCRTGDLCVK
jgi:hypothetical protein